MKNINSKLVSEAFTKLSCLGDISGINYYRDSLIKRNDLSRDELKYINIISATSIVFASQLSVINSMRELSLEFKSYMELKHVKQ